MRIKEILSALENVDSTKYIYFDFCKLNPTVIDSWRGSYNLPAIGFTDREAKTVAEFITELNTAISGKLYHGYKGGEYLFNAYQDLYVDNYGIFSETMVTGVKDKGYCVILCTECIDY